MIIFLKVLFSVVLLWMCYIVIGTSIAHNLFTEWDHLASIAWMRATLWDFYANILVIYCWVCYKERNWWLKGLWLVLLVTSGSIAAAVFMLIQLFRLNPAEGLKELFSKRYG
ncbi:DUF1475 family protein [Hufsiella ginkgonis]|uniref:DUF1475 domain-containing protein n=1 Tax=Hufsiella ginkgonis TaxID=2695274 RepID=A0A7K1Y002_9SPHI|nr:DUF1475 family protein [Hufsiella ginkgonis]MXV16106.1 DUF1475 domain-containing protein [Hufsiella ginkgonis]